MTNKYTAPQKLLTENRLREIEREFYRSPKDKQLAVRYYGELHRTGQALRIFQPFLQEMTELRETINREADVVANWQSFLRDSIESNSFSILAVTFADIAKAFGENLRLVTSNERLKNFCREASKFGQIYRYMIYPQNVSGDSPLDLTPRYQ